MMYLNTWEEKMIPQDTSGLYYEIFTQVNNEEAKDPRYYSLDLENPNYETSLISAYVGSWKISRKKSEVFYHLHKKFMMKRQRN